MKYKLFLTRIIFITLYFSCSTEQEKLNVEFEKLIQQRKYSEAEEVGKRAIEEAEKTFGPDHPEVAKILNNLGFVYIKRDNMVWAEGDFKRALEINEKSLGPEHSGRFVLE